MERGAVERRVVFEGGKVPINTPENALFKAQKTAFRLLKGEMIKQHKSPVPAMLLVMEGVVVYEQPGEKISQQFAALEYVEIPANKVHQVMAETAAYCILIQ